jgi:VWFA-related protein
MRFARILPRVVVVVFSLSPLAAAVTPQSGVDANQSQPQEFGESIEVRLHNLDAVVTDREGRPVAGLTKDDFVLIENGVERPITNFSAYDDRIAPATTAIAPDGSTPVATQEPASPSPPRRYVFFVDEMSIQGMARKKLRANAGELIRAMRPGDTATVVRPTGTTKIVQQYTGDLAAIEKALNKAIDSCKVRITAPAFRELESLRRAMQQAETPNEIMAAKREYVQRATDRVEQRLSQLRALVTSMSGNEGKKVLVIITSGLSARPGEEVFGFDEQLGVFERKNDKVDQNVADAIAAHNDLGDATVYGQGVGGRPSSMRAAFRDAEPVKVWAGMERAEGTDFKTMIDNLARTAAAEGVTIYAIEPEVPLTLDISRSADSRSVGSTLFMDTSLSAKATVPPEMVNQLLHNGGETLTSMTEKTGGLWFRGIGSIDETFRQVNNDLQVYYSLAYRVASEDPKAHKLKLSVRGRPELQVRTRSEVVDRTKSRGMADRVVAELVFPGVLNDLQMVLKAEPPQRDGKMFVVPVEVVIPVERMTFIRSQSGTYTAKVSLHYATALDQKEFVSYGRQEQIIELSDRQYRDQKRIRYRYTSSITVPKGNVRIALGVTDTTSSVSSLQTLAVNAR